MITNRLNNKGIPRPVEFSLAAVGSVFLLPVMAVVFVLIRSTSRGPAVFKQTRVGHRGKPFTLYKFRTMRIGREGSLVTAAGDNRITPVGRILRRTKIDELPELWNVIRGDLALVGPRPEVPEYVDTSSPLWVEVLKIKPGLTCLTTLELKNEESLIESSASSGVDPGVFYREKLLPHKLLGYLDNEKDRTWKTDVGVILRTLFGIWLPSALGRSIEKSSGHSDWSLSEPGLVPTSSSDNPKC